MKFTSRKVALFCVAAAAAVACSAAPPDRESLGNVTSAASGLTRRLWILNQSGDPSLADFFSCVLGAGSNWNDLANTYPTGESLDFGGQVIRNDDPCTLGEGSAAFYQCALDAGGFNVTAYDVLLVVVPDSGYGGSNSTTTLTNPVSGARVVVNVAFVRTSPASMYQSVYGSHEVFEAQTDGLSADCCDGETSSGGPFPWCPSCGSFDNGRGACGQYATGGAVGTLGMDTIQCGGRTFSYQRVSPANHEFDGTCDAIVPRSSGGSNPCKNVPRADNGQYCGASRQSGFAGGSKGTVYGCENGQLTGTRSCESGCYVAPPGQPDGCVGNPCARVPGADNGAYCGTSTQFGFAHGAPGVLYTCTLGQTTARTACARGCTVAPPGTPDHCN